MQAGIFWYDKGINKIEEMIMRYISKGILLLIIIFLICACEKKENTEYLGKEAGDEPVTLEIGRAHV